MEPPRQPADSFSKNSAKLGFNSDEKALSATMTAIFAFSRYLSTSEISFFFNHSPVSATTKSKSQSFSFINWAARPESRKRLKRLRGAEQLVISNSILERHLNLIAFYHGYERLTEFFIEPDGRAMIPNKSLRRKMPRCLFNKFRKQLRKRIPCDNPAIRRDFINPNIKSSGKR